MRLQGVGGNGGTDDERKKKKGKILEQNMTRISPLFWLLAACCL